MTPCGGWGVVGSGVGEGKGEGQGKNTSVISSQYYATSGIPVTFPLWSYQPWRLLWCDPAPDLSLSCPPPQTPSQRVPRCAVDEKLPGSIQSLVTGSPGLSAVSGGVEEERVGAADPNRGHPELGG